jgi:hypothetical protein
MYMQHMMTYIKYVCIGLIASTATCYAAPVMPSIEVTTLIGGTVDLTGLGSSNLQYSAFRYKLYSDSPGGFNFTLSSLNNSRLILQGSASSSDGFVIPFTVTSQQDISESGVGWPEPSQLSNKALDLPQILHYSTNTLSVPTGFAYILKINIPKNQKAFRGIFTDTLTFTIADQ